MEGSVRKILWNGDAGTNTKLGSGWATCKELTGCTAMVEVHPSAGTDFSRAVHYSVRGSELGALGWAWNGLLTPRGSDISRFGVLSMRMKVSAETNEPSRLAGSLRISLGGVSNRFTRSVRAGICAPNFADGQWHDVRIPLKELYLGAGKDFNPAHALTVLFTSVSREPLSYDLYVDDIALEMAGPGDEKLTCEPPKVDVDKLDALPAYVCTERDAHPAPVDVVPQGQLSPSVVSRTLSDFASGIDAVSSRCIRDATEKTPSLAGKVTIKFSVAPDGKVFEASPVCTSLPHPKTVECLRDAVKSISFPTSARGAKNQRMTWRIQP
jgi:hypothetical protein